MKSTRQFVSAILKTFTQKMYLPLLLFSFLSFTFFEACQAPTPKSSSESMKIATSPHVQQLAYNLLVNVSQDRETKSLQKQLAALSTETLATALSTDVQRKAFWINIYNAYILIILTEKPELYKNRGNFFSAQRFTIAGHALSFDQVEHGIIRGGRAKYSFGYAQDPFRSSFEKNFRVRNRDFRIHFALNCGARSCPPVRFYKVETLENQLEKATSYYLKNTSYWNTKTQEAQVTSLFSWFRGDFEGLKGVKQILKTYGVVPQNVSPKIDFLPYDWSLDLKNFQYPGDEF